MIDGRLVTFDDVPQSAWFATYVRESAEASIVSGYRDTQGNLTGKFGPNNSITVAEALKIASEGAGYNEGLYATKVNSGVDHWASSYVSVAKAESFPVIGRGGNIDRAASRAEVAALFVAAFRVNTTGASAGSRYTDVKANTDFALAIEVLSRDHVVSGDTDIEGQATGTFRPTQNINRAEVAKMIIEARAAYGTPGNGRGPSEESGGDQATENLVTYTDAGFAPQVLRIQQGKTVQFRNDSTGKLRVASDPHPFHTALPGFDAGRDFAPGETYVYTFTQAGSWGYHNHLKSTDQGTIVVE